MFALLGGVFGIFSSLLPELLKYFKAKEDRKHELAVMDRQLEAQKQGHAQRLEEINVDADIRESEALYRTVQSKETGVKWVDAALAVATVMVRPVITYAYFGLYALVKLALWHRAGADWLTLWTDTDQTMFFTVMGFWFGQRALFRNKAK